MFLLLASVHQAQIHLLGNVVTWASANVAALVYMCLSLWYLIRRRRKIYDIPEGLIPLCVYVSMLGGEGGLLLVLLHSNGPKAIYTATCLAIPAFFPASNPDTCTRNTQTASVLKRLIMVIT